MCCPVCCGRAIGEARAARGRLVAAAVVLKLLLERLTGVSQHLR